MTVNPADLKPGDRVNGWVWTGGETQGLIYARVVRVNRKTVTVIYEQGSRAGERVRIEPHHLNEIVRKEELA